MPTYTPSVSLLFILGLYDCREYRKRGGGGHNIGYGNGQQMRPTALNTLRGRTEKEKKNGSRVHKMVKGGGGSRLEEGGGGGKMEEFEEDRKKEG
ncbi:hypothetical protein EYF80_005725 [Liparis tanakae]|uniref:Uncharacterized protein n=1 Tax=Liparis tanakae TaxID=230148 RepID=A0A4Z2J1Z2_9TELE|nr:hypothetical protein EYF80_005725 [Liparis tanakae]